MDALRWLMGILRNAGAGNQAYCLLLKGSGANGRRAHLELACLHAWLLQGWARAWGSGEKPQAHELLSGRGLSLPLSFTERDLEGGGGEGRIDCVWGVGEKDRVRV